MKVYYIDNEGDIYVFKSRKSRRAQRYIKDSGYAPGGLGLHWTLKEILNDWDAKRIAKKNLPRQLTNKYPEVL